MNKHLINFYSKLQSSYIELKNSLEQHINNKDYFLQLRSKINSTPSPTTLEMASVFYFVNKTSFSGKWQVNKDGVMTTGYANYPDTRYRTWSQIMPIYHELIQDVRITNLDFKDVLEENKHNSESFVFLDPPYTNLKSMYVDSLDFDNMFETILENLRSSKAKILMVLGDGEDEREFFKDYITEDYDFSYDFYGKATNNKRKHLVIKNY